MCACEKKKISLFRIECGISFLLCSDWHIFPENSKRVSLLLRTTSSLTSHTPHCTYTMFFVINLFILFIFGCVGSLLLCGLSLVAARGGYSLLQSMGSRCASFSSCGLRVSSCGSRAVERRPSSCGARA